MSSTRLIFYLALFSAPLLLPYVLGPFMVRRKNSFPASPSFDMLEAEQLPPDVRQTFAVQSRALEYDGFSMVAYLYQSGQVPSVTTFLALLANRARGDMAILADMTAKNAATTLRTCYVEFATEFADGLNINTNNSAELSAFKQAREKLTFKFPEVRDPRALYAIHRRLLASHRSQAKVVTPVEGGETRELVRSMVRDIMRQESFGYYYLDSASAAYRPTWKGAVLMTWRCAWPVVNIRRALQKRASEAALRASTTA